jgi:hypothetical protein
MYVLLFNLDVQKIVNVHQKKSIKQGFSAIIKEVVSFGITSNSMKGIFSLKSEILSSNSNNNNNIYYQNTPDDKISSSIEIIGLQNLKIG